MSKPSSITVIGAGFAGLSAASLLAKAGHEVTIIEKNDQTGGRCRVWQKDGFTFDMGPSWYWMPDVFEQYYALFGKSVEDFYKLVRLDPSYRVYFGEDDYVDVPANMGELEALFESIEPGSSLKLREFLRQAAYKYEVGMRDYVFRPSHSIFEFFDLHLVRESFRIQMFTSMSKHVRQYFRNPRLIKILEFPVLFLGATPQNTPALYSLMNHADLTLGTWYPMGGMHKISQAMTAIAREQGVRIELNTEALRISAQQGRASHVHTNRGDFRTDFVIANADYRHADQELLDLPDRNYSSAYWDSRTMSPSSLLFYIGTDRPLQGLLHHTLFFDEDFDLHAKEIYTTPKWPTKPLFYVSATSKTDHSAAPDQHENIFILIPLAPGLEDREELREQYYHLVMDRLERLTGQAIRPHVILKRSYAMRDFEQDYHSFRGNAYGLANTLLQTAFFKPKLKSRKLSNLYYTGQLTVPGPGVPPSLISGQVVAREIEKELMNGRGR
ncbi:MAG: phytoene desaturase family protein [Bacteroidia bacterium]|nr:phytoene desaturase family protein [Bacteroidia bacterium]